MISGIKKVTLQTATETLVFAAINPRGCAYVSGPETARDINGFNTNIKDYRLLQIADYNLSNFENLNNIMINKTPITHIEVEGLAEHIYWKESATLLVKLVIALLPGDQVYLMFWLAASKEGLASTVYTTTALEVS